MTGPMFPVTFHWIKTGEVERFDSLQEIECNVEHFDSDVGEAKVIDAMGRPVKMRISLLNAEVFELEQPRRSG